MNDTQLRFLPLQRKPFLYETSNCHPGKGASVSAIVESYYRHKNWEGLLDYLKSLQACHLLVDSWKWQIGQMHIYTGAPWKAIDYLFPIHCRRPLQQDIQLTISEALYLMGLKNEQFHWICRPHVQKVDEERLLDCLEWISASGKPVPLYFLHNCIAGDPGKPVYSNFDLVMTLKHDPRFTVLNSTAFYRYSFVEIKNNRGAAETAAPFFRINWNSVLKTLFEPSLWLFSPPATSYQDTTGASCC